MELTGERLLDTHERALSFITDVIDNVEERDWDRPSPCSEWTVHDVTNHITWENLWAEPMMAGRTIEEVGDRFDGDLLGADPKTAWKHAAEVAFAAFREPGAMDRIVHASFGDIPAELYLQQMTTDLIIHGWDIARGAEQSAIIPPDLVQAAQDLFEPMAELARQAGIFGAEIPVGDDADAQTRLLAMTGRVASSSAM